jgi:hypothetical protein
VTLSFTPRYPSSGQQQALLNWWQTSRPGSTFKSAQLDRVELPTSRLCTGMIARSLLFISSTSIVRTFAIETDSQIRRLTNIISCMQISLINMNAVRKLLHLYVQCLYACSAMWLTRARTRPETASRAQNRQQYGTVFVSKFALAELEALSVTACHAPNDMRVHVMYEDVNMPNRSAGLTLASTCTTSAPLRSHHPTL